MPVNKDAYFNIKHQLDQSGITLVAVSKTKPVEDLRELYELGQRDFGENYVQELVDKQAQLPADIRWHFIGHLQSNKVKYIAPFVHLIHGVDSASLLREINKQGLKNDRIIDCLLQMHIAQEDTKFGLNETELEELLQTSTYPNAHVKGLMGMASLSLDRALIRREFETLNNLFTKQSSAHPGFNTLSMGMSSDYVIAIEQGSTMVRIGSLLFGSR